MSIKPILFNTEMVKAILDGRKAVTRRVVNPQPICYGPNIAFTPHNNDFFISAEKGWLRCRKCGNDPEYSQEWSSVSHHWIPPYQPNDIIYVRETWNQNPLNEYGNEPEKYIYKVSYDGHAGTVGWHPSIHMPKEAARIWLKVTNVRVERLQDITEEQARKEGVKDPYDYQDPSLYELESMKNLECDVAAFAGLWFSTLPKYYYDWQTWEGNPWVWVIEFERCEKPEEVNH